MFRQDRPALMAEPVETRVEEQVLKRIQEERAKVTTYTTRVRAQRIRALTQPTTVQPEVTAHHARQEAGQLTAHLLTAHRPEHNLIIQLRREAIRNLAEANTAHRQEPTRHLPAAHRPEVTAHLRVAEVVVAQRAHHRADQGNTCAECINC